MPNAQWNDIPFQLISATGIVDINPLLGVISPSTPHPTGPQWILLPEGCAAGAAQRVTRDNQPQKGGEIIHRKFKGGMVFQLKMIAVDVVGDHEFVPCCGEDLVDLVDHLLLILNGMENDDGRLVWTPSGKVPRLLDAARWLGDSGQGGGGFTSVSVTVEDTIFTGVQFAVLSPFPYVMNYPQTTTVLPGATPVAVTNTGSTEFFPVIHVVGPAASFDLINNTTGLRLSFDSSLPGAIAVPTGSTVEFDFFREVAYLGPTGGPYTGTNMKPGINIEVSDFWSIVPGTNLIQINGSAATMFWQPAYTG